jgi:hypothetical protein
MVKDIWNVPWQLTKIVGYQKHALANTPQSKLGIFHLSFWKNRETLMVGRCTNGWTDLPHIHETPLPPIWYGFIKNYS